MDSISHPENLPREEIMKVQARLREGGFDAGSSDGIWGPRSQKAWNAYQASQAKPAKTLLGKIGAAEVYALAAGSRQFTSGLTIDADGSPHAYHKKGSPPGLDYLANAGHPGNFWGIATTTNGAPYVQTDDDPAPGFYVSTTSLQDPTYGVRDPRRYVDSESIPFIALPPQFPKQWGVHLGDLARVENLRNGESAAAIFADVGPSDHLGEGSIALARMLGINADVKRGGATGNVRYTVFPGSGRNRPLSISEIESMSKPPGSG